LHTTAQVGNGEEGKETNEMQRKNKHRHQEKEEEKEKKVKQIPGDKRSTPIR
jgi:hypothetical protein